MNNIEHYFDILGTVNVRPDKTVDVKHDIYLKQTVKIAKLPVKFGTVTGWFVCSDNTLTTLQGSPQSVGSNFNCNNNKLTSLQGAPQKVGGRFSCSNNQLISLEGAPQNVGLHFYCNSNRLTSLIGAPKSVGGDFGCSYNPLTSLEGAPLHVGGTFVISYNKNLGLLKLIINNIKNLKILDAPLSVRDVMYQYRAKANAVTTLEQRNALAVQCAIELIQAGYRNNARL